MHVFKNSTSKWVLIAAVTLLALGGVVMTITTPGNSGETAVVDEARITPSGSFDIPEEMVLVSGGRTQIGSEHGMPSERPVFSAEVEPFLLDKHPVTVAQFRAFVKDTGYETEAERFGNAAVFDTKAGGWHLMEGATWEYPRGQENPPAEDDHPVTQVSWNDATAYADWAQKRLPTEVEWEYAARNAGGSPSPYAWGDSLVEEGQPRANTWEGQFPVQNTGEDGFYFTSPVGAFGETELGLTDMGGNVWEWTADWYRSYQERDETYTPDANSQKATRGGSFLCHESYCQGYRVSARSHSTPETSLFHVGFRCARDI